MSQPTGEYVFVYLGDNKTRGVEAPIVNLHINKDPEMDFYVNDSILLKLKEPLSFDESIQPACLGIDYQETYEGVLTMIGLGSISEIEYDYPHVKGLHLSDVLREGEVVDNTKNDDECEEFTKELICVKGNYTVCIGLYGRLFNLEKLYHI